ncbi:uncharacterized protein LOC123714109 isoform X2 [Pieris brassicae]|uniref:uncharacterized protein LOC123714109 isoform X2 n=1 Tax=Pieris brassicae TaxID=7116 RepID=UPI001E660BC3|nr:uncharacterized protein LOC123714109 isoform X2 [Pieris brassicae]
MEELSDHDVGHALYPMLHDRTNYNQANVNGYPNKKDEVQIPNLPRTPIRRYWHTNADNFSLYRKINTLPDTTNNSNKPKPQDNINESKSVAQELIPLKSKPQEQILQVCQSSKNEKQNSSEKADLSIFQLPVPSNLKKTIEILDNDECHVVSVESSDEDEVIEVALPPKPTITIESSDDEVLLQSSSENKHVKQMDNPISDRAVSSSPVPSIVSSVSDDFIRGDCIALNISSRHVNNESFDFSLHGSDLNIQKPSKKKRKKKNKDTATSTPLQTQKDIPNQNQIESCFATPKSKAKKKKKAKTSKVGPILQADIYDSDSNHSTNEAAKNQKTYLVTEKSLPSTDVYESDSNQSEQQKYQKKDNEISSTEIDSSDGSVPEKQDCIPAAEDFISIINHSDLVDLTGPAPEIDENIVMGNVTGFSEESVDDFNLSIDGSCSLGSTKIPAILCEDLDFDNLKGKSQMSKRRRYSLTTLRAEMDKFYNESWGGENFNHREIQKNMSRDKSLWVIDPKDKMPPTKRKVTCNYCNRSGHRDDMCRAKPPVCYMCGSTGHYETRCPHKICVNCGSPNHIYSNMCRNCANWRYIRCSECGQGGHPASHCPDLWRRYHDTTDLSMALEENHQTKKHYQHYCSGCTRRGHLVHSCRISHFFSGLPINAPYVFSYKPLFTINSNENSTLNNMRSCPQDITIDSNIHKINSKKRQSKSPVVHDTHLPKRRSFCSESDGKLLNSPLHPNKNQGAAVCNTSNKTQENPIETGKTKSSNLDEQGHMIQDNEVSDTSEVITLARIYLTNELRDALITDEGKAWLDNAQDKNHITLDCSDADVPFLNIKGTIGNQEAFQTELREWTKSKQLNNCTIDIENTTPNSPQSSDIPKNKNALLRKLKSSLNSLKKFLGEPTLLYKELTYHQNRRGHLLKEKVVSSAALGNNRDNIRGMMKKLNMVLLGQAGLAGGLHHLHQLNMLQEKITNLRQQTVSQSLRDEIGKHFHCIFSAFPRDDYAELVQKYNLIKNGPSVYKKKNNNVTFPVRPKQFAVLPPVNTIQKKKTPSTDVPATPQKQAVTNVSNKLMFCLNRVKHFQALDSKSLKARYQLDRKLRLGIAKLGRLNRMSGKIKKKMKKIQEEAQSFLSTI